MLVIKQKKAIIKRVQLLLMAMALATSSLYGIIAQTDHAFALPGETWKAYSRPAGAMSDMVYGNDIFVSVGSNSAMTSPDGITWTSHEVPAGGWYSVGYGNGVFVAVGTDKVMSSSDGVNWTERTSPEANNWAGVAYGNGTFIAISNGGDHQVMTSPNGESWTLRNASHNHNWVNAVYAGGQFVAVSDYTNWNKPGGQVMTSPDGITWTGHETFESVPWTHAWKSIAYGNGTYVAVSSQGAVMTSPDAATWTAQTLSSPLNSQFWIDVAYGGGTFVAVCTNTCGATAKVMTSPDGATWTARATPGATDSLHAVAYGNGGFVAAVNNASQVITSGVTKPYDAEAIAMHGQVIDTYDSLPIPYAQINIFCGEGGGVVIQADETGSYTFTMGELYAAIDSDCAFAGGIGMYASAAGYDDGNEEWSEDVGDEDWENWIAHYFDGASFDFHLIGDGTQDKTPDDGGDSGNPEGSIDPSSITDGNNDGILDAEQPNVQTVATATGGKAVTVAVDDSCNVSDVSSMNAAQQTVKDGAYRYDLGFVKFTATSCDNNTAHVQLYYHGVAPSDLAVRKYNPNSNAYFTITGASKTTFTSGLSGTLVEYTIIDNHELDLDSAVGVITDPVGLGNLTVGVPNTGLGGSHDVR